METRDASKGGGETAPDRSTEALVARIADLERRLDLLSHTVVTRDLLDNELSRIDRELDELREIEE
jgi:hypothetical protein